MNVKALETFVEYCNTHIKGDEKGEAQIFLDRFFTALGYPEGLKGAGADLEFRIRNEEKKSTSFADLFWPKKVLIEMKKAEEDLSRHLQQITSYWLKLAGNRPRYVILCNFNEFWIYDFEKDVYEPADKVLLTEVAKRNQALSFLLPRPQTPIFRTNREDVTEKAAYLVAGLFRSLQTRVDRETAMWYSLQCILTMFAEDVNLLPDNLFTRIIKECVDINGQAHDKCEISHDLIGMLFREMNTKGITEGGRYRGVDYFNGGLFKEIHPIELTFREVEFLDFACNKDWSKVNPAIFGSFFEAGMDKGERHVAGAHYTYEIDIKKIVDPVIVQPWKKKIAKAEKAENPLDRYYELLTELRAFKVLDPACGSGNFLFVAYREMKMLEKELLSLIRENSTTRESGKRLTQFLALNKYVSTKQFFGIDIKPFAVEIARMTLVVAKELWVTQNGEAFDNEAALPLENLEDNIRCMDALVNEDGTPTEWPEADAIIGNPPFQSKNKMQQEFGMEYLNKIRSAYPDVPGRADFCVYWFHKAHDHLKPNCRAGLVGTNTITQNYSREGSLDYIVNNGGTIYNAIESQKWSGEAAVYVSIACWKKGGFGGNKYLYTPQSGTLEIHKVEKINSSLSLEADLSIAKILSSSKKPKMVFKGQTHGHEGFLLSKDDALKTLKKNPRFSEVLKPYLIGDELVANINSQPERFVIDFTMHDMISASSFKELFQRIEFMVQPTRKEKAEKQESENSELLKKNSKAKTNKHHINFYNKWWQLSYGRKDMLKTIRPLKRFIVLPEYSLRPTFELISSEIRPNAKLIVFSFEDYYCFGILQSSFHWSWAQEKGATLGLDTLSYTTNTIWDTFPWPQNPSNQQIKKVAEAATKLHRERTKALKEYNLTLRELYRTLEQPGKNPIKNLHTKLDKAVMEAYGFDPTGDILTQLLELNLKVAEREANEEPVQAPGLPNSYPNPNELISDDCVKLEM
jgi:SAM-dependent methyltransferase